MKGLYDRLVNLMSKLEELLNGVPEVDTVSAASFDVALAKTKADICKLLNDTRDAKALDEGLVVRLNGLDELIADFSERLALMFSTLVAGESLGNNAKETVAAAESVVADIMAIIANIKIRINGTAMNELEQARKASEANKLQRQELQGILNDAVAKAGAQETEADEIEMQARDALEIAKEANKMAKEAVTLQEQAVNAVKNLVDGIANASRLAREADKAVDDATAGSREVLAQSQEVLNRAKIPLSDIGSDRLLQVAKNALGAARTLVQDADSLLKDNKVLIDFVRQAGSDVTELIDEGKRSLQEAAVLLAMVNGAVMRVDGALQSGRLALTGAEELRNELEDITTTLKTKKEALKRALNTLKKASSTNGKNSELSKESLAILAAARGNATAAQKVGKETQNLADQVLKVWLLYMVTV